MKVSHLRKGFASTAKGLENYQDNGKLTCNPECFIPAISEGNASVSVGIIQVLGKVRRDSKQFWNQ